MKGNRSFLIPGLAVALCLPGGVPPALAGDHDFHAVVHQIEVRCHTRRVSPFLMRVAGLVTRISRPEGVKSLRLAIFEDVDVSSHARQGEFESAVGEVLEKNWQPLVRVWSRQDGEQTQIYARESGKDVKLFIVTAEPDDAVIMEVRIRPETFARWMDDPGNIGSSLRQGTKEENVRATQEASPGPPPPLRHRASSDGEDL